MADTDIKIKLSADGKQVHDEIKLIDQELRELEKINVLGGVSSSSSQSGNTKSDDDRLQRSRDRLSTQLYKEVMISRRVLQDIHKAFPTVISAIDRAASTIVAAINTQTIDRQSNPQGTSSETNSNEDKSDSSKSDSSKSDSDKKSDKDKLADKISKSIMTAFGTVRSLYGQLSHMADLDRQRQMGARQTFGAVTTSNDYSDMAKRATERGIWLGYDWNEMFSASRANISSAGYYGQAEYERDNDALMRLSRAYELDPNRVNAASGDAVRSGWIKPGDQKKFANMLAASIKEHSMRGRENEELTVLQSINEHVAGKTLNVTDQNMNALLHNYNALASINPNLRGQRGGSLAEKSYDVLNSGDEGLMIMAGMGTKFTGLEGELELRRMLANKSDEGWGEIFKSLVDANGGDVQSARNVMTKYLVDRGMTIGEADAQTAASEAMMNGTYEPQALSQEGQDEGENAIVKQLETYQTSELAVLQAGSIKLSEEMAEIGSHLNDIKKEILDMILKLPEKAWIGGILAGTVAMSGIGTKIISGIAGLAGKLASGLASLGARLAGTELGASALGGLSKVAKVVKAGAGIASVYEAGSAVMNLYEGDNRAAAKNVGNLAIYGLGAMFGPLGLAAAGVANAAGVGDWLGETGYELLGGEQKETKSGNRAEAAALYPEDEDSLVTKEKLMKDIGLSEKQADEVLADYNKQFGTESKTPEAVSLHPEDNSGKDAMRQSLIHKEYSLKEADEALATNDKGAPESSKVDSEDDIIKVLPKDEVTEFDKKYNIQRGDTFKFHGEQYSVSEGFDKSKKAEKESQETLKRKTSEDNTKATKENTEAIHDFTKKMSSYQQFTPVAPQSTKDKTVDEKLKEISDTGTIGGNKSPYKDTSKKNKSFVDAYKISDNPEDNYGVGTDPDKSDIENKMYGLAHYVAKRASQEKGLNLNPDNIYRQWYHETGGFKSDLFTSAANIGGITTSKPTQYKQPDGAYYYQDYVTKAGGDFNKGLQLSADSFLEDVLYHYDFPGDISSPEAHAQWLSGQGYYTDSWINYANGMKDVSIPKPVKQPVSKAELRNPSHPNYTQIPGVVTQPSVVTEKSKLEPLTTSKTSTVTKNFELSEGDSDTDGDGDGDSDSDSYIDEKSSEHVSLQRVDDNRAFNVLHDPNRDKLIKSGLDEYHAKQDKIHQEAKQRAQEQRKKEELDVAKPPSRLPINVSESYIPQSGSQQITSGGIVQASDASKQHSIVKKQSSAQHPATSAQHPATSAQHPATSAQPVAPNIQPADDNNYQTVNQGISDIYSRVMHDPTEIKTSTVPESQRVDSISYNKRITLPGKPKRSNIFDIFSMLAGGIGFLGKLGIGNDKLAGLGGNLDKFGLAGKIFGDVMSGGQGVGIEDRSTERGSFGSLLGQVLGGGSGKGNPLGSIGGLLLGGIGGLLTGGLGGGKRKGGGIFGGLFGNLFGGLNIGNWIAGMFGFRKPKKKKSVVQGEQQQTPAIQKDEAAGKPAEAINPESVVPGKETNSGTALVDITKPSITKYTEKDTGTEVEVFNPPAEEKKKPKNILERWWKTAEEWVDGKPGDKGKSTVKGKTTGEGKKSVVPKDEPKPVDKPVISEAEDSGTAVVNTTQKFSEEKKQPRNIGERWINTVTEADYGGWFNRIGNTVTDFFGGKKKKSTVKGKDTDKTKSEVIDKDKAQYTDTKKQTKDILDKKTTEKGKSGGISPLVEQSAMGRGWNPNAPIKRSDAEYTDNGKSGADTKQGGSFDIGGMMTGAGNLIELLSKFGIIKDDKMKGWGGNLKKFGMAAQIFQGVFGGDKKGKGGVGLFGNLDIGNWLGGMLGTRKPKNKSSIPKGNDTFEDTGKKSGGAFDFLLNDKGHFDPIGFFGGILGTGRPGSKKKKGSVDKSDVSESLLTSTGASKALDKATGRGSYSTNSSETVTFKFDFTGLENLGIGERSRIIDSVTNNANEAVNKWFKFGSESRQRKPSTFF